MRKFLLFAVLVTATIFMPLHANADPDFSFEGSGWGEGFGLSQYGAKALGADGASSQQIIDRYFPSTVIASYPFIAAETFLVKDNMPVLVGISQRRTDIAFEILSGSADLCFDDYVGSCIKALPGQNWRFRENGQGECVFIENPGGAATLFVSISGDCEASVRPLSPHTVVNIPVKARSYQKGILKFRSIPNTSSFNVSLKIGIEDYLKGLSEVPESWPNETIKSQVIATRSLVLWHLIERGPESSFNVENRKECYCNLKDGSSDFIFRGKTGSDMHPNWVAAVNDTSNKVIVYDTSLAYALYTSSTGGYSESWLDVFGTQDHPYLVNVNDSYAFTVSARNPHTEWAAGYSQDRIADEFNFQSVDSLKIIERHSSGSVKTLLISGIVEGEPFDLRVDGQDFRNTLSLRSAYFSVFLPEIFDDVVRSHFFSKDIEALVNAGITKGCTETSFCPDRNITRAEMAAFLTRALNLAA